MAGAANATIYIDTNFVLDWLTHNHTRSDSHDVAGLITAICTDKIKAVTSVITKIEVLACKTDPTMWRAWERFQARRNVQVTPVTNSIADTAMEIRDYYQRIRDADPSQKKPPGVPDCIHVATAIVLKCDEMISFDRGGMDPKSLSPLELNGTVAGKWPLKIQRPIAATRALHV
ncbi:type II toxin-antitoxin system VapC family toxin [Mesorhizobium abyssinicae]|uniref:type II toxin-antitoxin system VapC family toxin n=1 Tax=Mesorhizobium abyssinicae TaxID=1209958 RepID=UPI00387DCED4